MKIKSFTYEKNWTGTYYRQRLLPSMQTMDRHMAGMLSDRWEIISQRFPFWQQPRIQTICETRLHYHFLSESQLMLSNVLFLLLTSP